MIFVILWFVALTAAACPQSLSSQCNLACDDNQKICDRQCRVKCPGCKNGAVSCTASGSSQCKIDCAYSEACRSADLDCTADETSTCEYFCDGASACRNSLMNCNGGNQCTVNCGGWSAEGCRGVTFQSTARKDGFACNGIGCLRAASSVWCGDTRVTAAIGEQCESDFGKTCDYFCHYIPICNASPTAGALTSPSHTTVLDPGSSVTLTWEDVSSWGGNECACSGWQVYGGSNPTPPLLTTTACGTRTHNVGTLAGGYYYWTISACNQHGCVGPSSSPAVYSLCVKSLPETPSLSSPANTQAYDDAQPTSFQWTMNPANKGEPCSAQPLSFEVHLSTSATFNTFDKYNVASSGSSTHAWNSVPVLAEGTWYWRVRAQTLPALYQDSSVRSFSICKSSAPTAPVLQQLPYTVNSLNFEVNWTHSGNFGKRCPQPNQNGFVVYMGASPAIISGAQPLPSTQTSFSVSWPGEEQGNNWYVVATNGQSSKSSTTQSFRVCDGACVLACVVQAPTAANLTSPQDSAQLATTSVELQWSTASLGTSCGEPVDTVVLLDQNNPPTTPVYLESFGISGSYVATAGQGDWYWRVVFNSSTPSTPIYVESLVSMFSICQVAAPGAVSLSAPADAAASLDPSTLDLQWSSTFGETCGNEAGYELYLSQQSTPSFVGRFDSSVKSYSPIGLTSGTWYWKISAFIGGSVVSSAVRSFSVCVSTVPDLPFLNYPPEAAFNLPSSLDFSWHTIGYFGQVCAGQQKLSESMVELFLDSQEVPSSSVASLAASSLPSSGLSMTTVSNLRPGRYYWRLKAVNEANLTTFSPIRTFTVCVDSAPRAPALVLPSNNTIDTPQRLVLQWAPLSIKFGDYGTVCDVDKSNRQVTVLLDTINPPIKVAQRLVHSASDLLADGLKLNTRYYWRVRADNGLFSADSEVYSFVVKENSCETIVCSANSNCRDNQTIPVCECFDGWTGDSCSEALCPAGCVQGQGVCTLPGKCTCEVGFGGADCATAEDDSTGAVVGVSIGLVLFICIVVAVLVALVLLRRRQRKFVALTPPDYDALRFTKVTTTHAKTVDRAYPSWDRLEDLLLAEDMAVVFALLEVCPVTEADNLAKSLIYLFENAGRGTELMNAMVELEISKTKEEGVLFRSNNAASKSFKHYSRMVGLPYLFKTLGRPLHDLYTLLQQNERAAKESAKARSKNKEMGSEMIVMGGMEVNPDKMNEDQDMVLNIIQLQLHCQTFLGQITRSEQFLPKQLIEVIRHVKYQIEKKFPDSLFIGFGNFLFLRLLTAAMVAPEGYGLTNDFTVDENMRRILVLISKVVQNLVNKREFGQKEAYMIPLNHFIKDNEDTLQMWYDKIINTDRSMPEMFLVPKKVADDSLAAIHHTIEVYREQIVEEMIKNTNTGLRTRSKSQAEEQIPALHQLAQVMDDLDTFVSAKTPSGRVQSSIFSDTVSRASTLILKEDPTSTITVSLDNVAEYDQQNY